MRQNPIRPASSLSRVVLVALIVLGIALVDLSAVWAWPAASPTSSPASSTVLPGMDGCGTAGTAADGCVAAAGEVSADSHHVLTNCLINDCRPGATATATSRPHAALARFAGRIGPDALRATDAHAHLLSLVALSLTPPNDNQPPRPIAEPFRPARAAGADRSIPRPPPA